MKGFHRRSSAAILKSLILACALPDSAFAQQPQTYLQGTGTTASSNGLQPSGSGSTLTIQTGSALCNGSLSTLSTIAHPSVSSGVNFVYVDQGSTPSGCGTSPSFAVSFTVKLLSSTYTSFQPNQIPIAVVAVDGSGNITAVVDARPWAAVRAGPTVLATDFPGSDACAQISNANTALTSGNGGVIDAGGITGTPTACNAGFTLGTAGSATPVTLELGAVTLKIGASIKIYGQSSIVGLAIAGAPMGAASGIEPNATITGGLIQLGDSMLANNANNSLLSNLVVNATNGTHTATYGIEVVNAENYGIQNVAAENATSDGVHVDAPPTSGNNCCARIWGLRATSNGADGLNVAGTADTFVSDSGFESNGPISPGKPGTGQVAGSFPNTYYVKTTYVTSLGETLASVESNPQTVSSGMTLQVSSPAAFPNVTGWNVYVSTSSGQERIQNGPTPNSIGPAWTMTSALNTTSSMPPTSNTAGTAGIGNGVHITGPSSNWRFDHCDFGGNAVNGLRVDGLTSGAASVSAGGQIVTSSQFGHNFQESVYISGWDAHDNVEAYAGSANVIVGNQFTELNASATGGTYAQVYLQDVIRTTISGNYFGNGDATHNPQYKYAIQIHKVNKDGPNYIGSNITANDQNPFTSAILTSDSPGALTSSWIPDTGSLTGGASGLTLNAGGSAQNITLTPSTGGYSILNGNVGVGTTTPSYPLDVNGKALVEGSRLFFNTTGESSTSFLQEWGTSVGSGKKWTFRLSDSPGSGTYWDGIMLNRTGNTAGSVFLQPFGGGNVGIGSTTTPALQLQVAKAMGAGVNTQTNVATSVTFDGTQANTFKATASAAVSSSTMAANSVATGEQLTFIICPGPYSFAWPPNGNGYTFKGAMSLTASKCNVQTFIYDGTYITATSTGTTY